MCILICTCTNTCTYNIQKREREGGGGRGADRQTNIYGQTNKMTHRERSVMSQQLQKSVIKLERKT